MLKSLKQSWLLLSFSRHQPWHGKLSTLDWDILHVFCWCAWPALLLCHDASFSCHDLYDLSHLPYTVKVCIRRVQMITVHACMLVASSALLTFVAVVLTYSHFSLTESLFTIVVASGTCVTEKHCESLWHVCWRQNTPPMLASNYSWLAGFGYLEAIIYSSSCLPAEVKTRCVMKTCSRVSALS